jgi:hypothetical protein
MKSAVIELSTNSALLMRTYGGTVARGNGFAVHRVSIIAYCALAAFERVLSTIRTTSKPALQLNEPLSGNSRKIFGKESVAVTKEKLV